MPRSDTSQPRTSESSLHELTKLFVKYNFSRGASIEHSRHKVSLCTHDSTPALSNSGSIGSPSLLKKTFVANAPRDRICTRAYHSHTYLLSEVAHLEAAVYKHGVHRRSSCGRIQGLALHSHRQLCVVWPASRKQGQERVARAERSGGVGNQAVARLPDCT
jgi:hypothetical protein